jgi:hypothetical protein
VPQLDVITYDPGAMQRLSFAIADAAVVADIQTNAAAAGRAADGRTIYDLRPLLDPREQPDEVIDMVEQSLCYAWQRGLLQAAPGHQGGLRAPCTHVLIQRAA